MLTTIFQFTSGISAPVLSSAWDTTRSAVTQVSQPTTRDGIFTALSDAIVAAGWTRTVIVATVGSRRDVFFSDGEDSDEFLCFAMEQNTVDRINFQCSAHVNGAGDLLAPIGDLTLSSGSTTGWSLEGADFTAEFYFYGNADYFWCYTQNTNTTGNVFWLFGGAICPSDTNPNTFNPSGALTASSSNVEISTTSDPLDLGYRPGDKIQVVETDPSSAAVAESQIITRVTTTSVEVSQLQNSYTASARIGGSPCRMFMATGDNIEPDTTAVFRSPVRFRQLNQSTDITISNTTPNADGEFSYTITYALLSSNPGASTEQGFGSGTTPSQSSLRYLCRSVSLVDSDNALIGKVPGLFAYPGSVTYYPHSTDTFLRDRAATPEDYVPLRFTATSSINYLLGPIPA